LSWIGRGERPALEILRWIFPTWVFFIQVSIRKLNNMLAPENYIELNHRHLNSSIDIMMVKGRNIKTGKKIAVRIQDDHHTHEKMSKIDEVQKTILNDFKIQVVDVPEHSCRNLFKDRVNYKSVNELTNCLLESEVKF